MRNVFLVLILLGFLFIGGCFALLAGGAKQVAKSIEKDANKAGGT